MGSRSTPLWLAMLALLALVGCTSPVGSSSSDVVESVRPTDGADGGLGTWFEQAKLITDRGMLAAAFEAAGYTPPPGTYLIVARVTDGVDQPAFEYFSLGDTAFEYSAERYWPASTVKVMAAVGALQTLGEYGLTGAAEVALQDEDGAYAGSVRKLYDAAITVSDNVAYNRLMEIAGFDELNDGQLVAEAGFPTMVLQRRFARHSEDDNLRSSPEIHYQEMGVSGVIEARLGTGQHPECPREGNCTTLFELLEAARRVALHDELPSRDRLPIDASDVAGLQQAMRQAPSRMEQGAMAAFGGSATIVNKTGSVAGDDRLDHGLIVNDATLQRYVVAMSMPYDDTSDAQASELVRQALLALESYQGATAPLQRDGGVSISASLDAGAVVVTAAAAEVLEVWLDGQAVAVEGSKIAVDIDEPGAHLLTVTAVAEGRPIGYRNFIVDVQ